MAFLPAQNLNPLRRKRWSRETQSSNPPLPFDESYSCHSLPSFSHRGYGRGSGRTQNLYVIPLEMMGYTLKLRRLWSSLSCSPTMLC